MNDVADPLAHNGLGRVLSDWVALSHDEPADWVALVKARYFACCFGAPMWGRLFYEEIETDADGKPKN